MPHQTELTYLGSEALDHLARMNTELLSELWILRDRVAVLEQVLTEQGTLHPGAIDNYQPGPELRERLELLRRLTVENVMGAPYRQRPSVAEIQARARESAAAVGTPIS